MTQDALPFFPPSLRIIDWQEDKDDVNLRAEAPQPEGCERCKGPLRKHGSQDQRYVDAPNAGKRVTVWIKRQRYRCPACDITWRPDLPDMHEHHRVTQRLVRWLESQFRTRSNLELAHECGLQEKTVRLLRNSYLQRCWSSLKVATPRILGIDEIYIQKAYRCVLTDLEHGTVYDLLPGRTLEDVTRYLQNIPCKDEIEIVCLDFHGSFSRACRAALPSAKLVIDKFHVLRLANDCLEAVRKMSYRTNRNSTLNEQRSALLRRWHKLSEQEQRTLCGALRMEPELKLAFELKEAFYRIYDATNVTAAVNALEGWRKSVPPSQLTAWRPLLKLLDEWSEEIFNYFSNDRRITNGFAEWVNQNLRDMNRQARGMNFEQLRTRAVLECRQRIYKKPLLRQSPFAPGASHSRTGFMVPDAPDVLRHVGVPYEELFAPWLQAR